MPRAGTTCENRRATRFLSGYSAADIISRPKETCCARIQGFALEQLESDSLFLHGRACPGHDVFQPTLRRGFPGQAGMTDVSPQLPSLLAALRVILSGRLTQIQQVDEQYYNGLRSLR